MNENKLKHLDFIQGVVNRMAANSFQIKGWSVTLVSALIALSLATKEKAAMIGICFIPVIVFWILDSYFLWQERLFREVYNDVRQKEGKDIDFSMNQQAFIGGKNTWPATLFSQTIIVFYGSLLTVMIAVLIFLLK